MNQIEKDQLFLLLLSFSEWLDADQHILSSDPSDDRTHEDLVEQFLVERR